jgi:hypothetical protein
MYSDTVTSPCTSSEPVIFKSSVKVIVSLPPADSKLSANTVPLALMFPLAVICVAETTLPNEPREVDEPLTPPPTSFT